MHEENSIWPPTINAHIIFNDPNSSVLCKGRVYKLISPNNVAIVHIGGNERLNKNNKDVKKYIPKHFDYHKFTMLKQPDKWAYIHTAGGDIIDQYSPRDVTLSNRYYHTSQIDPNPDIPIQSKLKLDDIDDFNFLFRDPIYASKLLLNDADNSVEHIESLMHRNVADVREIIIENFQKEYPVELNIIDSNMIDKYVDDPLTLRNEATKLQNYIEKVLISAENNQEKVYGTLYITYYDGYLHILRTDIPLLELITHNLLKDTINDPKLKILGSSEYDRPIRHNILKHFLFQSNTQKCFLVEKELLKEAELILGQEYTIALTPEPRYQLWTVIVLIKLWYGDIALQNNVRKIKMLVNQWTGRPEQKYNQVNGTKFSIGVYPRYGKTSASIVLKRLIYHFSLLYDAIGWKNNVPSYFKRINKLISYTNSNQILKEYYKKIGNELNQTDSSFTNDFVHFKNGNTGILTQYVPLQS